MTPEQKNNYLQKTYGITLEKFKAKLIKQDWCCGICGKEFKEGSRRNVDHIHVKGFKKMQPEQKQKYVRGILCFLCNRSLGAVERHKNPREFLEKMVEYFNKYGMRND